ncbi:hypothetical protein UPYG_G00196900 [Umbra pygmaea]|uniref:Uncharacterized protein n=1 Tax=Umbra pygmaea TaxID=75934 RepID=A0ABD0WI87_UMBPY
MSLFYSTLLCLFLASYSEKQWDFGTLTACITENNTLMLECRYPNCAGSNTPYHCSFLTTTGDNVVLGSSNQKYSKTNYSIFTITKEGACQLNLLGQPYYVNKTSYNCTLKRKNNEAKKTITLERKKYTVNQKTNTMKICSNMGLLLHQTPTLLWPVVLGISKWRIFT